MFQELMVSEGLENDKIFDWMEKPKKRKSKSHVNNEIIGVKIPREDR
jgi:hypothetical protein